MKAAERTAHDLAPRFRIARVPPAIKTTAKATRATTVEPEPSLSATSADAVATVVVTVVAAASSGDATEVSVGGGPVVVVLDDVEAPTVAVV